MVTFTLRQVTSILDGPLYQVASQVTQAVDADVNAFVYNAASQKFSHYATAADVEKWPKSLALAQLSGAEFYRLDSVTRSWPTVGEMNDDLADTLRRVQALADELNQVNESIIIDRTIVVQGA